MSLIWKRTFWRSSAITSIAIGIPMLIVAAAYPLGVIKAYPSLPEHIEKQAFTPIPSVSSLERQKGEDLEVYYQRLSLSVKEGIKTFWGVSGSWQPSDAKYTRVSFWDNYLLWVYSYLPGHEHFAQYEFALSQKTIERGYGYCSQVSRLVYYILEDQGLEAKVISQPSHVVVEVPKGIIDPTHGVFIPYSSDEVRQNVSLIEPYFGKNRNGLSDIKDLFSKKWDIPANHEQIYEYMKRMEIGAEIFKWLFPIMLLAYGIFILRVYPSSLSR